MNNIAIILFLIPWSIGASTVFWKQRDGNVTWDVLPLLERAFPLESQRAHHARITWMPLVKHVRASYIKRMGAYASWPPHAIDILIQYGGMLPWHVDMTAPCAITWVHESEPFLWGLVDAPEVCWYRQPSRGHVRILVSNATFTATRHGIIVHPRSETRRTSLRGWNVAWPPEWECLPPIPSSWPHHLEPLAWCTNHAINSSYAILCRQGRSVNVPESWRADGIFAWWDGRMHRIALPEDVIWDPDAERAHQTCASKNTSHLSLWWSSARDYTTQRARINDRHELLFETDSDGMDGWRLALSIAITLILSARLFHPWYDLRPVTWRVRIHRAYLFIDSLSLLLGWISLLWYWIQNSYLAADALWWMIAWGSCLAGTASWILLNERAFHRQYAWWWRHVASHTCLPWCIGTRRARQYTSSLKPVYVHGAWMYLHRWLITLVLTFSILWGALQWSTSTLFDECVIATVLFIYHTYSLYTLTWASQRFGAWPCIVLIVHAAWTCRDAIVWILPCLRTINVVYDDNDVSGVFLCLWASIFALLLPPPPEPLKEYDRTPSAPTLAPVGSLFDADDM